MYIRTKTVGENNDVTLIVTNISSVESKEDGTSVVYMLNGHQYNVVDTQRRIRTQLRKSALLSNAAGTPEPETEDVAPA